MSGGDRSGDDQFALFDDDERREHLRAAVEASDRWMRRRLDCECRGAWWVKECACQVEQ